MNLGQVGLDLVADPQWRWLVGMRVRCSDDVGTVVTVRPDSIFIAFDTEKLPYHWELGHRPLWPDLRDNGATAGALLELLVLRCRVHPTVTPTVDGRIAVTAMGEHYTAPTRAVALALALQGVR